MKIVKRIANRNLSIGSDYGNMATSPSKRPSGELPVGDYYRRDIRFELEITRIGDKVYEVVSDEFNLWRRGPTEDIAIGMVVAAIGGRLLHDASVKFTDSPQDGTRQIVGDKVTSEELRDTYLGPETERK